MDEQDPIPPAAKEQIASSDTAVEVRPEASLGLDPHEPAVEQAAEIPAEDANSMIDIDPPHLGGLTRRDFFVHLFIVVLGILIAIGLEQAVEYLHHRILAAEARTALIEERHADETANDFNIFATEHHEQDLQHDLAILDALRAHKPLPSGPFIVRHPTSSYPDDEWQKVHQSGTINYVTGNAGHPFRYEIQHQFTDLLNRSNEDLARAASVLRTSTDPPSRSFEQNMAFSQFFTDLESAHENLPQQQIDAAWATVAETGNVAALSQAQIDSLERAIQIALADDDAMLNDCFTIKRNLIRNPVQ